MEQGRVEEQQQQRLAKYNCEVFLSFLILPRPVLLSHFTSVYSP